MSITPNMNLTLPDVSITEGPEWAETLNSALEDIDEHDHTSSKGTKVPTAGLDINDDLSLNEYSITDVESTKLAEQSSTLICAPYSGAVYNVNGDLYFTNNGGIAVQITDGNSIVSSVVVPPSPLMPSGAILDFAGTSVPVGFLECNGAVVAQATYVDLFAAIGTTWNTGGEGGGNFRLPNFSGRTTIGRGTYTDTVLGSLTRTIAQVIGAASHFLTSGEMPSHTHIQNSHLHADNNVPVLRGAGLGAGPFALPDATLGNQALSTGSTVATNQNTGGDGAHNNMQPSAVVMKIIKT